MIPFIFIGVFLIWNLFKLLNPITWLIGLIILLLLLRNSGWFLNLMLRIGGLIFTLLFLISIWTEFKPDVNPGRSVKVIDSRETTTVTPRVQERTSRQEEEQEETDQIISHYRVWNDFTGNKYEGEMRIFLSDFQKARKEHEAMDLNIQGEADWPKVYYQLLENDRGRLNMLYSMFDSIQSVKQLDRLGFAEMVVSCIQDIPYYLVLPDECAVHNHEDPFVRNFIENRPGYCIGNISYGVQSPAEFLGNLKGDCDTRVALLFAIFNHYKYNVAILGSNQFKHAVLGIELPGAGLEMNYRGINYKLWETTSGGFRPGILAPEVSDLNYWNFYLTN